MIDYYLRNPIMVGNGYAIIRRKSLKYLIIFFPPFIDSLLFPIVSVDRKILIT